MRLIDADALIRMLEHSSETWAKNTPAIRNWWSHAVRIKDNIVALIKAAPTIEAEPVKHGRWIFDVCNHREHMKCSECLHSYEPTGVFTYCPNCGAKMDGGAWYGNAALRERLSRQKHRVSCKLQGLCGVQRTARSRARSARKSDAV